MFVLSGPQRERKTRRVSIFLYKNRDFLSLQSFSLVIKSQRGMKKISNTSLRPEKNCFHRRRKTEEMLFPYKQFCE